MMFFILESVHPWAPRVRGARHNSDGYGAAMSDAYRPDRNAIAAAADARVADVIAPGLSVLFCGINPGLYSGAVGHHFARPGNRFWKTLHAAGFTPRVLSAFDERELLDHGLGITNLVNRATATADGVAVEELRKGATALRRKVRRYRPRWLAMLGLTAYRTAFLEPDATVGPTGMTIGRTNTWLLPNPSGLNAHYQLPDLARVFSELREASS
jgi:TDG/mug DNA glycosylase family protein